MKERFLNFLKWFFIILGVLFFIMLLLLSGIFIGFNSVKEPNFNDIKLENANLKEIQPVIDYAEKYRSENNKYPSEVSIKLKKGEYKYSVKNDSNCFEVEYNYKKIQKNYGCCKMNSENSNSKEESYSQITN